MSAVVLDKLTKRFGATVAVDSLDLSIADDELFVLLGSSGCGKTTTLRLVAGLEQPTSGEVRIRGQQVTALPPRHRHVGMVFQHPALHPQRSVRGNLAFGPRLRGVGRGEIERRVRDVARLLEIELLLERLPGQLSAGQQQRVALARALACEPGLLLLDEPLSGLDAPSRTAMRGELLELQRRLGQPWIYVTHDQDEAMLLGNRVAVLHEGGLQQVGAPQSLYDRPANRFVAEFVGSPPMNILPGALRWDSSSLQVELADVRIAIPPLWTNGGHVPDGPVLVGIRPEDLAWGRAPNPGSQAIRATVESARQLGPDTLCTLKAGTGKLLARSRTQQQLAPGAAIDCYVDPQRMHLFDAASGKRICVEQARE